MIYWLFTGIQSTRNAILNPFFICNRMHFCRRKYIWGDLNLFIWLDHEMWRQVVGKGFNVWFVSIVQLGPADICHNYKIWILKTVFGHWWPLKLPWNFWQQIKKQQHMNHKYFSILQKLCQDLILWKTLKCIKIMSKHKIMYIYLSIHAVAAGQ